jgi:hypothetical protein
MSIPSELPLLNDLQLHADPGRQTRTPRSASPSSHTPNQCRISVLPDETLLEIFSYVPLKAHWEVSKGESQAPLVFVCKRWRRVYEPVLFRRIPLSIGPSVHFPNKTVSGAGKLLALMETNPRIRNYPHAIHLELNSPAICPTFPDLLSVVERCPKLHTVVLHSNSLLPSLPLFQAITSLPLLEDLTLGGYSDLGPTLEMIFKTFSLPNLKRLKLESYQLSGYYFDPILPFRNHYTAEPMTEKILDDLQAPFGDHRSSVKTLELLDPRCQPIVTGYILRGYSHLVDLTLTCFSRRAMDYYSTDEVQKLLNLHSKSLRRIKLGYYAQGKAAMPNFNEFPCLEEVYLSAYNVLQTENTEALGKLCAPKLRLLALGFNIEDEYIDIHNGFKFTRIAPGVGHIASNIALWIQHFALFRRLDYQEVRLGKVTIDFKSSEAPNDSVEWPWEQLEAARQKASADGLAVEYLKPDRHDLQGLGVRGFAL